MKNTNTKGQFRGLTDLVMPMMLLGFIGLAMVIALGMFSVTDTMTQSIEGVLTTVSEPEPELQVYNPEISKHESGEGGISPIFYISGVIVLIGAYFSFRATIFDKDGDL